MFAATTQAPNRDHISIWQIDPLEDLMANYSTCRKFSGTMTQAIHIPFDRQPPKHNMVLLSPQFYLLLLRGLLVMQVTEVQRESLWVHHYPQLLLQKTSTSLAVGI
jgi:hypothetical protein